jgi:lysophospholipase L1-like esterase
MTRERDWAAAWTTAPQRPGPGFASNWSEEGLGGRTVRQTVRLGIGGDALRVRLSNRYGATPLRIAGATVAASAGGAAVKLGTLRELTVDGASCFAVPPGTDLATDGIVVIGDSLTDGTGGTPGTDQRFPDLLARRPVAAGRPRAVLNQGIGGNRVTVDSPWLGDRATARFGRDVLAQPGVGTVVVFLGINDVGIGEVADDPPFPLLAPFPVVPAAEVIAGHRDMIGRARAAGRRTVGATLGPMRGTVFSTARSEAARAEVNAWIRGSGEYDAVLDFAAVLGDALDPVHDSGDHLHPGDAGYRAMAGAVDLDVL